MTTPCEYTLAEKPCIDRLVALGYEWLKPHQTDLARDGQNQVILRDVFQAAIRRINGISEQDARAVYHELLNVSDNERWTALLRGNFSRTVVGEAKKKTIHLIDFLHPEANTFTVTNQLEVRAQKTRRPDLVAYVNGVPLVVIEAKSPVSVGDRTGQAFEQIKQYEQDVPRLFYSNAFSMITDGMHVLYGPTGATSSAWLQWKDPWPRAAGEFSDELSKALWCLLEPARLLDLLAHYIVFERRQEKVIKKMARYQQYRAAEKIVQRVVEGAHDRGLIWHTQGSGKSLTMVFATLKLKAHLTLSSPQLASPNILVVTDRIDLDDQISGTFQACGLPNPRRVGSIQDLRQAIHSATTGLTMLSTIYKFEGSRRPVEDSRNWIVLVDECHRTQEKDLGAFVRATLPEARFFGFTGTPVKTNDLDTYANFGVPGEGYLDRYSIDDAVADGATVPVFYNSRKAEWHIDAAKLDILFDQRFANEPEENIAQIKQGSVTVADLAKLPERIRLIAYDIWTHFREHAMPDGFKAQVVCVDRQAVILYKRALDDVIAESLEKDGLPPQEARAQAEAMSACVYSSNQDDAKPSEDPFIADIRRDLCRHARDSQAEREVIENYKRPGHPLCFMIVCNKLLTGFDAPLESVMYLDSPLREHNLLQAIARTNRPSGPRKEFGLIVDYIGITKRLKEALASYREADVQNAMRDLDVPRAELRAAHTEVMTMLRGIRRGTPDIKAEYDTLIQALGTEDAWFTFRRKGRAFIRAYEALAPDPAVLDYTDDLKWVAGFLIVGRMAFEKEEGPSLTDYSAKIRAMLEEHLHVTGLRTLIKLRDLTDPDFTKDFTARHRTEDELRRAAIRKSTELKKILREKVAVNPLWYGPFSERVLEILRQFEAGQLSAADTLEAYAKVHHDLQAEEQAHTRSGLSERAYGVYKILEAFLQAESHEPAGGAGEARERGRTYVEQLAEDIDGLYTSDTTAPVGWHVKEQLRKELRQQVRRMTHQASLCAEIDEIKEVSARVEDYALKVYVKVG